MSSRLYQKKKSKQHRQIYGLRTITLDKGETRLWKKDGPDGAVYRKSMRSLAQTAAREHKSVVQILAHDGDILDDARPK